ncbi:MAG: hypothetical protein M1838_004099 [Thelocarpon superellum]|nr:MAG: hypothetical protein M1838_004099 [Thelocarpon superellum]
MSILALSPASLVPLARPAPVSRDLALDQGARKARPQRGLEMTSGDGRAMNGSSAASPIFLLPLEIRQHIYAELLSSASCANVHVLQVSRQIYHEAQPYLFQRPVTFASQYDLYEWMRRRGSSQLHHVKCLGITVVDIKGHQRVKDVAPSGKDGSISPIARLYEDEVGELSSAMQHLSGVRDLSIFKPRNSHYHAYRHFSRSFCAVSALRWPRLQRLSCQLDHVALDFLTSFPDLRSLRFSGFSATPPRETLQILSSLRRLDELELIGPPPGLFFQQRAGYTGPFIGQSLAPGVMRGLRPLRILTICDVRDPASTEGEVFFVTEMLAAIMESHGSSLRRLNLSADFTPSPTCLATLHGLLSASELQHLELGWPDLESSTLQHLPSSLRSLHVYLSPSLGPQEAAGILVSAVQAFSSSSSFSSTSTCSLPHLREVVFNLDGDMRERFGKSAIVVAALASLRAAGLRASVDTWAPVPVKLSAGAGAGAGAVPIRDG